MAAPTSMLTHTHITEAPEALTASAISHGVGVSSMSPR